MLEHWDNVEKAVNNTNETQDTLQENGYIS